ncbi:MAG TPA: UPF0182 family protein [Pyrinomonadaceae bacterium]|nr:UPF0182 family protein [Pyrinomonadaceae bacterium]
MSTFDHDPQIIDVDPPKKFHWKRWLLALVAVLILAASRGLNIYISALWFGSLGYSQVYWKIFKIKTFLFFLFVVLTVLILRGAFFLITRGLSGQTTARRTILINNQPFEFSPARFVNPIAWGVSIVAGLVFGFSMKESWQKFATYYHQASSNLLDPIFNKPLSFYLFSLPVYELLNGWFTAMAVAVLIATLLCYLLLMSQQTPIASTTKSKSAQISPVTAVSWAVIPVLLSLSLEVYLTRFPYLWEDHQTFSGVTYTEANYVLPALSFVSIGLITAAVIAAINALTRKSWRLIFLAAAIPVAIYLVGVVMVPAYVTSFVVKPNELGRETPYIDHNINWTRRGFALENIEQREFDAENSVESLNLNSNRATLENIRLWDLKALQDTLRQIQEIRTYYDFPDVDVDRYQTAGQTRQMMVAAREMDVEKLPEASRNWINEKLIYTHGYGVTMNTANGFDSEGMPIFSLSNMPSESKSAEIKVTRPEIYYGQKTNTDVYVRTRQKEFDYPQGETNSYTSYEGTGGIRIGTSLRRLLLAYALGDISKLPFSDDITSDSRVLIHRNILDIVNSVAPFLTYDNDPYIVVGTDGRLYWMIDAFTESATYPYSRHYVAGNNQVNYIRNSVKTVIDAYNGTVKFYVFDAQDPIISTYRATFPTLFEDASQMPAFLRDHVRYPESLIHVQGDVFGLYHTQNAKVFFQREDLWSVANQVALDKDGKKTQEPLEPYFVLMQLPGENIANEFAIILPFTPANRNNMIGWMAGRCDGENYGKLLVYNFPKSRLIDGPLQIEARIDQNAQLSGQFTLWNQQGSRVLRGHLLVIPIGRSLLYVEPIYLRAESSPMPELRLVVLAIQDKVGYGKSFEEAMTNLFGEAPKPQEPNKTEPQKGKEPETSTKPSPGAASADAQQLILRAIQEFDDYQRLTSQGKLAEAGQKLEQHKRTIEELKRLIASQK